MNDMGSQYPLAVISVVMVGSWVMVTPSWLGVLSVRTGRYVSDG